MASVQAGTISRGTRNVTLSNHRLYARLVEGSLRVPDFSLLVQAWEELSSPQQMVLVVLYSSDPDNRLSSRTAAGQLSLQQATVVGQEKEAIRIMRRFLANPHSWTGLSTTIKNMLLRARSYRPEDLTADRVQALLAGSRWGPKSTQALNAKLAELEAPSLEARLH